MRQQDPKPITLSRTSLIIALLLAALLGGLIAVLLKPDSKTRAVAEQTPAAVAPKPQPEPKPTPKPVTKPKPVKPPTTRKATVKKPVKPVHKAVPRPAQRNNEFIIQGRLITGGDPWAANMIRIKVLWLKNKNNQQFLIGREIGVVQATPNGFVYRIRLRPQTAEFINWNSGVEGNIGRVIAFLDQQRDGRLSPKQDTILAVSKELIRYRTGRYDMNVLNKIQQQNIRQAGKGYVVVSHEPIGNNKMDWKVIARDSPVRLDLDATETSLPKMYNTFLKVR